MLERQIYGFAPSLVTMKSSGRRKRKASEISQENHQQTVSEEKKSAKGNCRRSQRPPEEENCFLLEKDQTSPSTAGKSSSWCESLPEMARVVTTNLQTGKFLSSAKMKLQFFPVNETTRIKLEEDGHNPFLELTLSARKKMSSILKHLNNKWGSSSAAMGELMLLPYNMRPESYSACRRWTSDNSGITAGDLYEILDSPPVFRLRYGWFSNIHPESSGVFCASLAGTSKSNNIENACNPFQSITRCLKEQLDVGNQEIRNLSDVHNAADLALTGETSVAVSTDHVGNEVMAHITPAQTALCWDDSFTNLSIGGLLSEASLFTKIRNSTLKSDSKSGLQPILVSDISIGGLLQEASLQEKITNPKLKSENKSGLQSRESVTETDGLIRKVPYQYKYLDPDLSTENDAVLNPSNLDSEISANFLLPEASLVGKISGQGASLDEKTLELQPLSEQRATQSPWDDGLTTLSIGGLLSEASLQAKIADSDPKAEGGTTNSLSRIPNFDSFDAFLAAQFNSQPQTPNLSLLDLHAEDTCHAFPFQEISSFNKDPKVSNGGDNSMGHLNDSRSKTVILPRRHKCFPNDSFQQKNKDR